MSNLQGKKFAMVMGQSVEGCGVTRTSVEMQIWANKNNVDLTVFSYDERIYNRRDAHELDFVSFMKDDIPQMVEKLNGYDAVLFNSYPSAKFENDSIIAFYEELVKKITTVKVGFMHELNKTNIDKVPFIVGIMNEMDVIYNFSEDTWFANTISEILPSKTLGERVKKFTMWFNFEELNEKYRSKYSLEDKEKKLMYIGRWTTMKDPRRVLDLAPILKEKDPTIKWELQGIERSIGAKCDIFDHPNTLDLTGKKVPETTTGFVPVYGPYVREEGMEKLAKTLFGANFYRMPKAPQDYGDRMEYTQIETIAVGTIPVFDKHWGENNRTRTGERYIDIPFSAVYSDKENLEATADLLVQIANSPELQEKYRETSYQIAKQEFDSAIVLPEMFEYILSVGKDTEKYEDDDALILGITGNEEYVTEANNLKEQGELIVLGIRELTNNVLCVIDGKKEKEIKKWRLTKKK
jgi:glycosyltransferase involved in cell wall biosynthesis